MEPRMTRDAIGVEPESTYTSTPEHSTKESATPSVVSNVPSGSREQSSSDIAVVVSGLVKALRDEGRSPAYHQATMQRHRREWPVLWKAIDRINELWPESAKPEDIR